MQKIKKPISILLAVLMVVSLFTVVPFTASAAEAFSGEGTVDNPYLITSAEDWNTLASNVNNSSSAESYSGKYFKLTDDISVSTMIGKNNHGGSPAQTNLKSFCGIFDGDGHTVNVNINSTSTHGAAPFSATKNATIKNLTVTGTLNGGIHSSGLVGVPNGTLTVENVTVSAAVTADSYLGGFVGHNFDAITVIKSSIFNGSLTNSSTTKQYIGGFIGWGGLDSSHPANITLDGCLFDGTYSKDKTNNFNPVGYSYSTYGEATLNNFYSTVESYGSASGIPVDSGSVQEIQDPVTQVMTSSTSVFYDDFSAATANWTDGSTLTLLADVTMNSTITVSGTRTLDLNGYGITKSNQGRLFNVNGNLTINDSNPTRSTHKYTVDETGLAALDENGTQSFQGGYITGGHGYTPTGETGWGGFAIVDLNHKNQNYSLTINGGTIIGNKTDIGGGGVVRVNNIGTFTMNGGAIIYNTTAHLPESQVNDGAVSGETNVKFYIRGGTIAHNTTKGGVTSDLYLANNQKVIVDGELDSATSIGIKMQSGTGAFTNSTDKNLNDADKFFSDNSAYGVLKNTDGQLELKNVYTVTWKNWNDDVLETDENVFKDTSPSYDGETPTRDEDDIYTYTFSGWNDGATTYSTTDTLPAVTADTTYTAQFTATAKPHEHDGVAFQPWTSSNSLPTTAGSYYLTSDVTLSATWEIPTGTTNLCLNGHSITKTGNEDAIRMDAGRNLNLYDCGTQTRYYIIDSSTHRGSIVDEAAYNAFEGTKGTFTGGYITSTQRGFVSPAGDDNLDSTVNMYGGTVFGCSSTVGSAVYSFGKFNIYGGAFIGNCSSNNGNWSGTVYNAGQLKMSGGLIRHNYAYNGAGIFQEIWKGSSLTITGGQIIDNTASNQGGGVFSNDQNSDSAKIYISGNPVITGNKKGTADNNFFIPQNRGRLIINNNLTDGAEIGITMQNGTGVFTDSTDTTLNDASKFFSDDSNYNVRKNPSGQLEIGSGYTVTWKNWDGTVLETDENVSAGTTPTYDGAEPTRPSDSTYNYYFTGWEPTVDAITGDTTYTATYRSQKQIVIKKGTYIRMGAYKDYYVDWFCALQNSTGSMMLTDCVLRDMVFGSNSTYKTSNVHNWLDEKSGGVCDFATDLGFSQAEMDLARKLNLSSKYGDGTDKFIIPSFEELKGTTYTKAKVIYDQNTTAFAYWLRTYRTSGGKKDNNNERVVRSQYSKVDERYRGVIYNAYVRPMFYIDTNKVKTMPYTGSGTKADPYVFETRQEVAKNVTILGSGATGGGDVTATATRSDITQRTDQKLYISTLPNKLPTNSEVTVTAKPSAGYEFVRMEVLDADNHRLAYTADPENPTATFTLSGNVKVNAVFKKVNTITFYSDIEGTKVWKTVKRTAYEPISDMEPTVDNQGNWTGEYQLSDQNNELFTFGGWATESGKTVWSSNGTDTLSEAFDWTQNMPAQDVELYPVWVANYINVRLDLGAYDAVAVADVAAGRNNWYDASRYDEHTPASMGSPTYGDANYQSRSFWKSTNITASTPDKDKYINMNIMNAAQRAGYTLDGWYNSSGMKWEPTYLISREYGDKGEDGKLKLTYDAPYRNFTYTITLTAKWNLNDAKVTYDVGEGSGTFTDDASYKLGNIITIPSGEPTPPAGTDVLEYVFRGWEDAKGDLHLPGERFAYSDEALISTHGNPNEIKLTAAYQEIPIGTLAFLSQGGSLIDPIKSEQDTTVDLTQYVPTRSGYIFEGWYTEPEYTNRVDSIAIIVNQSKRVYAKWTAENHNLFFFLYNGGSLFETITKAYNTDVTAPADPTRTGYTFKGWDKTIPLLMPAQDMTFYGTWDIHKWKVTYQLYDDVTNEVTQHYGETVVEPEKPTRDGYTFERWVDENGVEKTFPFIMPDQNVILKAEWKKNQAAPTNLTVTEASSDVSNDGKIEGVDDTMEYSLDGGKTWIPVPADETEIDGLAPGTVQIRYQATEDKNPSPATEVEVKVKAKLFVGHSISLNGDVALNFFIDPKAIGCEDFSSFDSAIVTFTWDEGNGEKYGTASVNLKEAPRDTKNPEWFKATCNVVAAHMGYEVFAELYLNDAEEPIETDVYSVREYAEELYYNTGTPDNLKNLVKSMLNYGAAAQLAFQRDLVDDSVELANSNVGENGYKDVTPAEIAAKIKSGASNMNNVASQLGAKYFTTSLLCLSENKLRVYFTPTTYPGQIPNAQNFAGNKSGYYYYVESEAIPASKLDEQQDLSVNNVPISLSALDYAKELAGDMNMPEEQRDLAKALFLYNQAANKYFGED